MLTNAQTAAREARSLASLRFFDGSQSPAAREALERASAALTEALDIMRREADRDAGRHESYATEAAQRAGGDSGPRSREALI